MITNEQDIVNRAKRLFVQDKEHNMTKCIRQAIYELADMAELSKCLAENDIFVEDYIEYLYNKMYLGEI